MDDLIKRQDAIDALDCMDCTEEVLRSLPPAYTEVFPREGEIIISSQRNGVDRRTVGWTLTIDGDTYGNQIEIVGDYGLENLRKAFDLVTDQMFMSISATKGRDRQAEERLPEVEDENDL